MYSVMPRAISRSPMMMHFRVRMGTRDDLKIGVGSTCLLNKVTVLERTRDRADEPPGTSKVRGFEDPKFGSVAEDDLDATGSQRIDDLFSLLYDEVW